MRNTWCGDNEDTDSLTSSNISLNLPKNSYGGRMSSLKRSPFSSERLNSPPSPTPYNTGGMNRTASLRTTEVNKRPTSAVSSARSSSRVSSYRPSSFYGRSSSGVSSLKGYNNSSNLKNNLRGPSFDVLHSVVDIVNNLLIPYVSLIVNIYLLILIFDHL